MYLKILFNGKAVVLLFSYNQFLCFKPHEAPLPKYSLPVICLFSQKLIDTLIFSFPILKAEAVDMPLSIIGTLLAESILRDALQKGQLIDFMNEFLRSNIVLVQYRHEIN